MSEDRVAETLPPTVGDSWDKCCVSEFHTLLNALRFSRVDLLVSRDFGRIDTLPVTGRRLVFLPKWICDCGFFFFQISNYTNDMNDSSMSNDGKKKKKSVSWSSVRHCSLIFIQCKKTFNLVSENYPADKHYNF
jgi:hypothetical protein